VVAIDGGASHRIFRVVHYVVDPVQGLFFRFTVPESVFEGSSCQVRDDVGSRSTGYFPDVKLDTLFLIVQGFEDLDHP